MPYGQRSAAIPRSLLALRGPALPRAILILSVPFMIRIKEGGTCREGGVASHLASQAAAKATRK